MNPEEATAEDISRFEMYVGELTSVIGHPERVRPLNDYCTGLLVTDGRRSVEPIAAMTAPAATSIQHQKLLHFVANSPWADKPMLAKVRELVLPAILRREPIQAWIIDDTSFPKSGSKSVGVHHQYCGQLGKQANCQVAVTLSVANHYASLPIGYRLYLPREWAKDKARRKKARIPKEISFTTKPEIALEQIGEATAAGGPRGAGLVGGGYGVNSQLRASITALGLTYAAAIIPTMMVRSVSARGELGKRISVRSLALRLPKHTWRTITWREGTNKRLSSRFARVQVRTAPIRGAASRTEETLLIEWPEGEPEPTKYWLSTLDKNISFRLLVDTAKMRWRVERDYQDLKQEVGLGHYEGRSWPGFHHHATLCIAIYGFLVSEREMIPPSGLGSRRLEMPTLPAGYRPRGAANPAATAHPQLDRDAAPQINRRPRPNAAAAVPVLRTQLHTERAPCSMTQ